MRRANGPVRVETRTGLELAPSRRRRGLLQGSRLALSSHMATPEGSDDKAPPPRSARLILVTPAGAVLGSLPAIPVSTPWWPRRTRRQRCPRALRVDGDGAAIAGSRAARAARRHGDLSGGGVRTRRRCGLARRAAPSSSAPTLRRARGTGFRSCLGEVGVAVARHETGGSAGANPHLEPVEHLAKSRPMARRSGSSRSPRFSRMRRRFCPRSRASAFPLF